MLKSGGIFQVRNITQKRGQRASESKGYFLIPIAGGKEKEREDVVSDQGWAESKGFFWKLG